MGWWILVDRVCKVFNNILANITVSLFYEIDVEHPAYTGSWIGRSPECMADSDPASAYVGRFCGPVWETAQELQYPGSWNNLRSYGFASINKILR